MHLRPLVQQILDGKSSMHLCVYLFFVSSIYRPIYVFIHIFIHTFIHTFIHAHI